VVIGAGAIRSCPMTVIDEMGGEAGDRNPRHAPPGTSGTGCWGEMAKGAAPGTLLRPGRRRQNQVQAGVGSTMDLTPAGQARDLEGDIPAVGRLGGSLGRAGWWLGKYVYADKRAQKSRVASAVDALTVRPAGERRHGARVPGHATPGRVAVPVEKPSPSGRRLRGQVAANKPAAADAVHVRRPAAPRGLFAWIRSGHLRRLVAQAGERRTTAKAKRADSGGAKTVARGTAGEGPVSMNVTARNPNKGGHQDNRVLAAVVRGPPGGSRRGVLRPHTTKALRPLCSFHDRYVRVAGREGHHWQKGAKAAAQRRVCGGWPTLPQARSPMDAACSATAPPGKSLPGSGAAGLSVSKRVQSSNMIPQDRCSRMTVGWDGAPRAPGQQGRHRIERVRRDNPAAWRFGSRCKRQGEVQARGQQDSKTRLRKELVNPAMGQKYPGTPGRGAGNGHQSGPPDGLDRNVSGQVNHRHVRGRLASTMV